MKKPLHLLVLLLVSAAFTSCATVFCGSKKAITLDANVPVQSANLIIDGHKYRNVTFPYVVKVKRGFDDSVVKAEAEGYQNTELVIYKSFNAVSSSFLAVALSFDAMAASPSKRAFGFMKPSYVGRHFPSANYFGGHLGQKAMILG